MPKGIYDRSGAKRSRKTKGKRGRPAVKAKATAVKKVPHVIARLNPDEVVMSFAGQVAGWHRQSIVLACSAATAIIIGAHAKGGAVDTPTMVGRLQKSINGRTGLKDAQVHKYIGLARALVNHLRVKFKVDGPVAEVLTATRPQAALDALTGYLETQHVKTLEGLSKMFGKYRRTKPKAHTAPPPPVQRAPVKNGKAPVIGDAPVAVQTATATKSGLTVTLGSLPVDFLMLTAVQAGHEPAKLAEAAIALCAMEADLAHVEELVAARRNVINAHGATPTGEVLSMAEHSAPGRHGSRKRQAA